MYSAQDLATTDQKDTFFPIKLLFDSDPTADTIPKPSNPNELGKCILKWWPFRNSSSDGLILDHKSFTKISFSFGEGIGNCSISTESFKFFKNVIS